MTLKDISSPCDCTLFDQPLTKYSIFGKKVFKDGEYIGKIINKKGDIYDVKVKTDNPETNGTIVKMTITCIFANE